MRRVHRPILAVVVAGVLTGGALSASAPARPPGHPLGAAASAVDVYIPYDFSNVMAGVQGPLHRPRRFAIPSADSTLHVRHVRWHGLGTSHATARGRYDWCTSACPAEPWHGTIRLSFSRIKRDCLQRRWYSRLRMKYDHGAWGTQQLGHCV